MLSILVYGRNDSHGYNLHKRAALSFNCLAHVLDDEDDEIVFVDYNTPPEMPTFVEAIRDTLTDEALQRLRVIRVPASIHAERFAAQTHLPVLEPIARNVGLRRTNPANRWILSTNTDMLLLPKRAGSLSEVVTSLDDGYYALPRFELPEALWESLDRRDPERALACVGEWGTSLYLDEIVTSHRWMGFDAPGDFQLVPREQLFAMDGFEERMLLGWHVDSNLSRRLSLVYGEPRDLRGELRGYHCNHTRVLGAYHAEVPVENDADRFVFEIDDADIATQRGCWGLADLDFEESRVGSNSASQLPAVLRSLVPPPSGEPEPVEAHLASALFHYRAPHVLAYLASALAVLPAGTRIAYVGVNPELRELLMRLLPAMGFTEMLLVVDEGQEQGGSAFDPDDQRLRELARGADVVIFDFGLPATRAGVPNPVVFSDWPLDARGALGRVCSRLDALVRIDTDGPSDARPDRGYVAINAAYNLFEPFVTNRISGASAQFNSRVRHGFAIDPPTGREDAKQRNLLRYLVALKPRSRSETRYRLGALVDLREVESAVHLDGAWSWFEPEGIWTEGARATVLLDIEPDDLAPCRELLLNLTVSAFHVPRGRSALTVDVGVNGVMIDRWEYREGSPDVQARRCLVDQSIVARERPVRIELRIHDPRSPLGDETGPDGRPIGLRVTSLRLEPGLPALTYGQRLDACAPAPPTPVLWKGWSTPEAAGTWTDGSEAVLRLPAVDATGDEVELVLDFSRVYLEGSDHPRGIEVTVNGTPTLCWWFTAPGQQYRSLRVPVAWSPTTVVLSLPWVMSPQSLGFSDDNRRLGVQLRSLRILEPPPPATKIAPARRSRRAWKRT